MRRQPFALLLCLLSLGAEARPNYPTHRPLREHHRGGWRCRGDCVDGAAGALFQFLPSNGAGAPFLASTDLCSALQAGDKSGNWWCLQGNGSASTGSAISFTNSGSPTSQTIGLCPSGLTCTTATSRRYDGTTQRDIGDTAISSGSFSICVLAMVTDNSVTEDFVAKWGATAPNQSAIILANGSSAYFYVSNGTSSSNAVSSGTCSTRIWQLICGTYQYVGDGTSAVRIYVDGVAGTPNTTAVGPAASNSTPWWIGNRTGTGAPLIGQLRGAVYTEKVLSPTDITRLYAAVMPTAPAGSKGEALTFARSSTRTCSNGTGYITLLDTNKPCVAKSGLAVEASGTNLSIRSEELDNAAWTTVDAGVGTANSQVAPDGTLTAEVLTSTSDGGYIYTTTPFAISGTNAAASVYTWTTTSTQAVAIELYDTTASASICTATATANTTPTQVTCRSAAVTSGHSHEFRLYPGGLGGTGAAIFWGTQVEARGWMTSYIRTAGSTVTRSTTTASFTNPLAAAVDNYCMAATINSPKVAYTTTGVLGIGANVNLPAANESLLFTSSSKAVFRTYDATPTGKDITGTPSATATSRIKACITSADTPTIWTDAVSGGAVTGTGTGVATQRTYLGIGEIDSSATYILDGFVGNVCVDNANPGACVP